MKINIEEKFNKFNKYMLNTKIFKIPLLNKIYTTFMNKEVILYLIFGVLTTLINFICFFILSEYIFTSLNQNTNISLSNLIAFIIAVLFAFITNKLIVFGSNDKNTKKTIKELLSFICARIFTFLISTGGILLTVNILFIHKYISKIIFNIIEIVLNYLFSKLLIFRKKA
ncbi:MAG: GtrA family protein [Clostridiales bacterium]|nr:GtrA family protein [Clostridiales bacterium]